MATLKELAARLRTSNPKNEPMVLRFMARIFWPDANWLEARAFRHNGGPRKGELAAAGIATKLAKRGLLKRPLNYKGRSAWQWALPLTDKQA